jgi:hypothetical protein
VSFQGESFFYKTSRAPRHQRAGEVLAGNQQPPAPPSGAWATATFFWSEVVLRQSNVAEAARPVPISMPWKQGRRQPIKRAWWGGITKWACDASSSKCAIYHQLCCRGQEGEEGGKQNRRGTQVAAAGQSAFAVAVHQCTDRRVTSGAELHC